MVARIFFAGSVSWLGRVVSLGLGLTLMPVLFRHLSREELGVWLLLGQSCAVLGIFDLGFGAILTRRIAFAVGRSGGKPHDALSAPVAAELAGLVAIGRRVYRWLALAAFVFSFGSGLIYLRSLELREMSLVSVWIAWGVLCLAQALGIWTAIWTCLLQGRGYVGWDSLLSTLINSVTLAGQILLVLFDGGLESLALAAAAGALVQRWLLRRLARGFNSEVLAQPAPWRSEAFRQMVSPAVRAWLTSVGCLLIANTDPFFIAAQKGVAAIPAYRAGFVLLLNLHLLAGVFCGPSQVFISQLWQAGRLEQIHAILRRNARIGLLALSCGGGTVLVLGPTLFDVWLGPGNFIGYPVLAIFLATFVLEHQANVFGSCGRATGDEGYAYSSLLGAGLKLGLAFVLGSCLGLAGLALSTLLAQGLTNDWYMVYRSCKRVRLSLREHVKTVLAPCLAAFVSVLVLGFAMDRFLSGQPLLLRVGAVSALAAILLGALLWGLALDAAERNRVLRWVTFA